MVSDLYLPSCFASFEPQLLFRNINYSVIGTTRALASRCAVANGLLLVEGVILFAINNNKDICLLAH